MIKSQEKCYEHSLSNTILTLAHLLTLSPISEIHVILTGLCSVEPTMISFDTRISVKESVGQIVFLHYSNSVKNSFSKCLTHND